jgi:mRNA-degrading endonuclease RelE of RelBE toxin-antitoxin system
MYSFDVTDNVLEKLKECNKKSPSISVRLEELANNPMGRAIPTHIPLIGDYYVNAGRYCILFNVDQTNSKVTIISVKLSPYLDKILRNKIPPQ